MKIFNKFSKGNANFIDKTLNNIFNSHKISTSKVKDHRYTTIKQTPEKTTYINPEGHKIHYYKRDRRSPGTLPDIDDVTYILENLPKEFYGPMDIAMTPKATYFKEYYKKNYPQITEEQIKERVNRELMTATPLTGRYDIYPKGQQVSIFPVKGYNEPEMTIEMVQPNLTVKKLKGGEVPYPYLKGLMTHEIAHGHLADIQNKPPVRKLWKEHTQSRFAPTKYGVKTYSEDFAETMPLWMGIDVPGKLNPKTNPISIQRRFGILEEGFGDLKSKPTIREESEQKLHPSTLILEAYKEHPEALLASMRTEEENYPRVEQLRDKIEGRTGEYIPIEELKSDKITKNTVPLKEAKYLTLYHGTSKERAKQILESGKLKPGHQDVIFVTPSKSAALIHSKAGPEEETKRFSHRVVEENPNLPEGVVFKVTIPTARIYPAFAKMPINFDLRNPKDFKETYELHINEPVENPKPVKIKEFKQRAYGESRIPERVGIDYGVLQKGPFYKEKYKEGTAIESPTEEMQTALMKLLPESRQTKSYVEHEIETGKQKTLEQDKTSNNMAFDVYKLKYYEPGDTHSKEIILEAKDRLEAREKLHYLMSKKHPEKWQSVTPEARTLLDLPEYEKVRPLISKYNPYTGEHKELQEWGDVVPNIIEYSKFTIIEDKDIEKIKPETDKTSSNYMHIGKADGKDVIYKHKGNYPSVKMLDKIYKTIPDDKNVPVVLETRKQYLSEYVANQEKKKGIKFSEEEKKQYMKEELEKLKDVDARFTTYHNRFIAPRVVIFPQKDKINEERIKEDIYHEYGHELWEKNKKLRKKWKFRKATSPTLYGTTDKEEDMAESYMLYKLHNPKLISNPNAQITPRLIAIDTSVKDRKRIKNIHDERILNPVYAPNPTTVSKQMNIKKEIEEEEVVDKDKITKDKWGKLTTTPIADYPESFGYTGETIMMPPQKFLDITHQEAIERVTRNPDPADEWILGPREDYEKVVIRPKNVERLKPILASEEKEMNLPYLEYRGGIPIGHEGRHRAAAARELGMEQIPVRVIYTDKQPEVYNG